MLDGNSQDGGSVSVPIKQDDNPLLRKLTPQQFDASIKFYEADKNLNQEDRGELASDLQSAMYKTAFIGYGSAMGNFFLPTIAHRFQQPSMPSLPTNKIKPLIHKPFLSFLIGLTAMLITNQQVAKYQFSKKINSLEAEPSKKNQLETWKAMDYHQASLFFLYYRKTAENTSFIVKDPRSYTEKTLHEVHYNPPSKDHHFTKTLGIGQGDYSDNNTISHWDQIRIANGFTPSQTSNPPVNEQESSQGLPTDQDTNANDDDPIQNKHTTAWDAIRQSRK